jgi:16S rRNA G1207 methylase RsmC
MQWSTDRDHGNKATGQFSTPEWVAELLCSRLSRRPEIAADLGIGKGSLALALAKRFPSARIIGVDSYPAPRESIRQMCDAGMTLSRRDVSTPRFVSRFVKSYGQMDTIISNPPFTYLKDENARQMLCEVGIVAGDKKQRLDLVFLAQAMKILRPGGEAAFILPVSAFSMSRSLMNLQTLVDKFGLVEMISLPQDLYGDAEVQTAVLIMRPGETRKGDDTFTVYAANDRGIISHTGLFSASSLIEHFTQPVTNESSNSLAALGSHITRGRYSSKNLAHQGVSHFHTTSFQKYSQAELFFEDMAPEAAVSFDVPAKEGDILIPRVGTRCLGRAAIVVSGSKHISDCVFRISTPPQSRYKLWEFFSSEAGTNWQLSLARGACAKFITQQDLLIAPLPFSIR